MMGAIFIFGPLFVGAIIAVWFIASMCNDSEERKYEKVRTKAVKLIAKALDAKFAEFGSEFHKEIGSLLPETMGSMRRNVIVAELTLIVLLQTSAERWQVADEF